jgi:hypothetical protein
VRRERTVRQLLADKVSGTLVGLWLLIPEHLRLGTWDLLRGWTVSPPQALAPHLALQVVHEAALTVTGLRQCRTLSQKGFELANGLPAVVSDQAIHELLNAHTVAEAIALQRALGRIRRASGHFQGRLVAVDPHRLRSFSRRQMVRLKPKDEHPAQKVAQTFFCLDADTCQPVCFTTGSSSRTAIDAAKDLLPLAADILQPPPGHALALADVEHHSAEIFEFVRQQTPFDLLMPMPHQPYYQRALQQLPPSAFHSRWVGFATAAQPFCFQTHPDLPLVQWVQRFGEDPQRYAFKAFLCTSDRDELPALSHDYPKRWHVEEFFHDHQDLGWKRAGTLNMHIRYGQMTLALIAQAALSQLRQRLPPPWQKLTAAEFAKKFLRGLDGDIRVRGDTIQVTYYNAPQAPSWRHHFENLPGILEHEKMPPQQNLWVSSGSGRLPSV